MFSAHVSTSEVAAWRSDEVVSARISLKVTNGEIAQKDVEARYSRAKISF